MVGKKIKKVILLVLCKLLLITFYGCPSAVSDNPDLMKQPENVVGVIENNNIHLTWDHTENSKYYAVYKKEVGGQWVLVSDLISTNSYFVTSVQYDKEFYYGVSAKSLDNESEISPTSRTFILTSTSIIVAGLQVKSLQPGNSIALSWEKLKNNISYHIYRSEVETDKGDEVATITGLTYTDTPTTTNNLRSDTVYYYRVLWTDNSNGATGGETISPVSGFYFTDLEDTREPNDNDKDNEMVQSENLTVGDINSVLFKKEGREDTDWFRFIVPPRKTYNFYLNGLLNKAQVNVFIDDTFQENKLSDTGGIVLENSTANDIIYYFQVFPVTGVTDFIEPYTLTINNNF